MTQLSLMPEREPDLDPKLGQFFTLPRLADRIAREFPISGRVLEPTAGNGNLVNAICAEHFEHATVTAVELDPRWATVLRRRFANVPEDVQVLEGDVLTMPLRPFDWVVMNPPDASKHGIDVVHFLERAADLASEVVALLRTNALHCGERWRGVWSNVRVRAVRYLVQRPRYVGNGGEQEWSVVWFGRDEIPLCDGPCGIDWWPEAWS